MYVADGDFIQDIEVNDLRNRYLLTKGSTQEMVKTSWNSLLRCIRQRNNALHGGRRHRVAKLPTCAYSRVPFSSLSLTQRLYRSEMKPVPVCNHP